MSEKTNRHEDTAAYPPDHNGFGDCACDVCFPVAAPLRERYARAVLLLQAITAEAESLNAALAADEITQKQARARVQNIHGLAATPEVEEWEIRRVG